MMQNKETLNLARKWRPKTFDQIVGQEIPVRMLQNGLFLQKTFPVYLFAGQRGCGKTTTARVFGAAVNCHNLQKFQENPSTNKIPCLECESCKSMALANHPDFIEIDAASHTGVENVRQILEACTYMPLFGKKKIYLIDEAHMLSKAAFNAFLKILEEPPASALFILATTEIQKFPETVLSRCFQVIFKSVENETLKTHLKTLCTQEGINVQDQALDILIQETEGSVRDAINLLERVRFSQTEVSVESILHVLGKVSEKELLTLFQTIIEQKPKELLEHLNSNSFQNVNSQTLWNMLVQICRSILWVKFGVANLPMYINDKERLQKIAAACSLNRLNAIFQLFWSQEELFLRTPNKQVFLEILLLQICQQVNVLDLEDLLKQVKNEPKSLTPRQDKIESFTQAAPSQVQNSEETTPGFPLEQISQNQSVTENPAAQPTAPKTIVLENKDENWQNFLTAVKQINDPFLVSAINQIRFIEKNEAKKLLTASINNNSSFLKDSIQEKRELWLPLLNEQFPGFTGFEFITAENAPKSSFFEKITPKTEVSSQKVAAPRPASPPQKFTPYSKNETYLNIANTDLWPKANLLSKYFPGKIKVVKNYN